MPLAREQWKKQPGLPGLTLHLNGRAYSVARLGDLWAVYENGVLLGCYRGRNGARSVVYRLARRGVAA